MSRIHPMSRPFVIITLFRKSHINYIHPNCIEARTVIFHSSQIDPYFAVTADGSLQKNTLHFRTVYKRRRVSLSGSSRNPPPAKPIKHFSYTTFPRILSHNTPLFFFYPKSHSDDHVEIVQGIFGPASAPVPSPATSPAPTPAPAARLSPLSLKRSTLVSRFVWLRQGFLLG